MTQATHRTREALPAPLPPKCLYSLHPVPDTLLALLALRHAQPYVARLAVWVAAVHGEAHVVVCRELAITCERARRRAGICGREERVTTLGAEEVLLVVCALAQLGIVERDEPLVDDGRLAVVASRRELLMNVMSNKE